jgi:hypothetical protein
MGSSSKNRNQRQQGGFGNPAKPQMATQKGLGGDHQYYVNPSEVPAGGGWVKPPPVPGSTGGIALNWAPPGSGGGAGGGAGSEAMARAILANQMADNLANRPGRYGVNSR